MNGSITIYQPNVPSWFAEKHYAALEQSVTFKVTLDEEKPTSRNQRWYRWAINDKFVKITQEPNMRFQFVNPGKYEVTIEVMANNAEHMANAKANILKYFVIVLNGILVGQANQVSISNISISNTVINLI